ncbi:MAG: sugar phosphate isomerase/epimerase [Candidatus Poribacteria bacterium]|nr:sugar phosphate isomerase/epimerase [Candidatus Poribacteria bacterium]
MSRYKIGCQLIIYGSRPGEDLPGVLAEISAAGYDGVETGNLTTDGRSIDEAMALLTSHNLELAGVHTGYGSPGQFDEMIAFTEAMGCGYLMVSGVGGRDTLEDYKRAAEVFNKVGRRCHDAGIKFCYHNHSWEFKDFGGTTGLVTLYESTDPKSVHACVDTYWVQHGGEDPAAFLKKYADRVAYLHFKDMNPDGSFGEVGHGILDWAEIMKAVEGVNAEWLTVEQDRTDKTPEESVTMSCRYMRETLGI